MTKPLLYLDVDGVLNIYPYQGQFLNGHPACPAVGLKGRFARILDEFEVVWATAWLGSAHQAWKYYCGFPDQPFRYVTWDKFKLPAIIRDAVAQERRWAFVDDDAEWELRGLGWTREMTPGLVLCPDEKVGLTDQDVDALLDFAGEE